MFQIKPSEILYSQDSIKPSFDSKGIHGNKLIGETLDDICEGRCRVDDIPTISVLYKDGNWVSADNRRLWVLRQLERLDRVDTVLVKKTNYINPDKLTSTNGGDSIQVRGNPGGKWRHRGNRNRSRGGKRNRRNNKQQSRARSHSPVGYLAQHSHPTSSTIQTKQPIYTNVCNNPDTNYTRAYNSPTTYNTGASNNNTYTSPATNNTLHKTSTNNKSTTSTNVAGSNKRTPSSLNTCSTSANVSPYNQGQHSQGPARQSKTVNPIQTTPELGFLNSRSAPNTNIQPGTSSTWRQPSRYDAPVGTYGSVQPCSRTNVYIYDDKPKESSVCLTSLLKMLCCCCFCDSD